MTRLMRPALAVVAMGVGMALAGCQANPMEEPSQRDPSTFITTSAGVGDELAVYSMEGRPHTALDK